MDCTFKYSLSRQESVEIISYLDSLDFFAYEQLPIWSDIVDDVNTYCYFIAQEKNNILGFAKITETKNRFISSAHIQFGPICKSIHQLIESIEHIYLYYKNKNYTNLSIQLAISTGANTDYIEYSLNKKFKINYYFDKQNWSSIGLDLSLPIETIFKNFSKGHKSDIKKASNKGLLIKNTPLSILELKDFIAIYNKMNRVRQLFNDEDKVERSIKKIYNYILEENRGDFYLVKDINDQTLGGIIVLKQGKSIRYYKGASDPERRDLPILHLALWKAIQDAHNNGFKFFDFWGYNHMVTDADQVFFINKFKKGFGGEFTFYPKIMHFVYKPINLRVYYLLLHLIKLIKKHV